MQRDSTDQRRPMKREKERKLTVPPLSTDSTAGAAGEVNLTHVMGSRCCSAVFTMAHLLMTDVSYRFTRPL
jgi:hypothetical protein